MTTLCVSTDRVASSGEPLVTAQCDVCCPPIVVANTRSMLRGFGWSLVADGAAMDVCPLCRRRRRAGQLIPRRDRVGDLTRTGTLPNLVVIGAAKCGTTSLHAYLDAHPEISMSRIKEVQYFQDPHGDEWIDYYKSLFDPAAKVTGEASPLYTRLPIPGIPERMAELVPDAKLIYMVRDPVERAISFYVEERQHDAERRPVSEAFADPADPTNLYVYASRYAEQLARFTAAFDPAQILVVDLDDLERQPAETLARVFTFVGVDPEVASVDVNTRHNTRQEKAEYSPAVRRLRSSPLLKVAYLLPPGTREKLLAPLRRRLSRPITRPEISPKLRNMLEKELAPDADELRRATGQRFAGWSV